MNKISFLFLPGRIKELCPATQAHNKCRFLTPQTNTTIAQINTKLINNCLNLITNLNALGKSKKRKNNKPKNN